MSFEDFVKRAAKATVIVRATNNPEKENSFTTGFVVGHCKGLCIIMTIGHFLAPDSDQMLEVIFFGHPDEVFFATVQLHQPESEILLLTVEKRDEIETGRLIFESEDGWELGYLQTLVSVSHPCSFPWRAACGIINCPEFVNTAIEQYDNQMILFDHSLQLAVGSSGAALINEHGKIVGIQSGEISSIYLAMSGQPVSDALDMMRSHTHALPFGPFTLHIADLVYGYQQLHNIKTIPCSLKQAVHIKYIDKVLRSFLQEHFITDISKVSLNDLLEQYFSINPSVGSFKSDNGQWSQNHPTEQVIKKAMAYSYLSDLKGDAEDWVIRVRICRMWDSISTKDNTLLGMNMVLIDEKENLMHAAVHTNLVPRFKRLLTEGLIYNLRNVKVTTNIYMYRPLASNMRLLFLATTGVQELGEDVASIPRYGFQFVNQAALRSRADDVSTLSDIVGCFCGFGKIEVVGAGCRKRDIRIFTDYSVTSTVTLWGKLGELFDPALYTVQDDGPHVIVVSSVTVKTYRGAMTFATTSGSRIYVNPDVEHVTSIRERFSALSPKVVAIEGPSAVKLPPKEAMFVNWMNVEALVNATCDGELKVDVVTLKATITDINKHYGWYYVSCKSCVRKAVPRDGVYICNGCGKPVDLPLALFRVNVQVEDGTGTTTVVLFNSATERLLHVTAKKLINKMPPGDTSVPAELDPLLGKELVFKLKLNKYNFVDGLQDYRVSAVYTPVDELESAHAKNALAAAVNLVEAPADEENVPESDNKRKRKLSSVIEDISGGSNRQLSKMPTPLAVGN